ncbi:MAG: hypothetical protein IKW71_00930, partial [Elusimicrobiaceae bacterium]|nr:hypothetical protein [Elusimicrobiaceae bacterium]
MHTFLCRLMIAVFLLNCVLPGAWAEPVRTGKKKKTTVADMEKTVARAATQAAQSKTPYQNWQAAQAELEAVLKEPDLTPQEKQFAELELQIVNTHMEFIDRLDSFNATQLNRAYGQRLEQLKNREEDLEKQNALRDFYQEASSNWGVAAAVDALHKHADQTRRQSAKQDQTWNEIDQISKQLRAQTKLQPSTLQVAPPAPARLDTRGNDEVLKRWADNKLSLEELVEYADPILLAPNTPLNNNTISDGAELLAIVFNSYSAQRAQLDKETLARISWLAQRAKYRALHRLDVLQQQINIHPQTASTMMQARGNLVLLAKEADKFTKMSEPAPSAQEDTKLASYKLVKEELAAYNPQSEGISTAKFAHEIVAQIKKDYQGHPSQDDAQFELLARNLSYTVQYLLAIGNTNLLLDLMVLINEDGADIHGYNEVF